ncbi:hypothetical protein Slin14017_G032630 [Septoria linicola]|nr:hypothetical protein Slin14017_G032630 [Septoria linicola]
MSTASAQAAGGGTASVSTVPTQPVDARDGNLRHIASRQKSPTSMPKASPAAAEESNETPETVASLAKLTKSERRNRLWNLRNTKDVENAKRLIQKIIAEWSGNGLHVFEALRVLAGFEGEAVQAIEMGFEVLEKLGQCWALRGKDA